MSTAGGVHIEIGGYCHVRDKHGKDYIVRYVAGAEWNNFRTSHAESRRATSSRLGLMPMCGQCIEDTVHSSTCLWRCEQTHVLR